MGRIHPEVLSSHLRQYPLERHVLGPFQLEFDVTWGARRTAHGSDFSSYILRPDRNIQEAFGLGAEVALFYFDYSTLEPRNIQAINQVLTESPMAGRVEPSTYFIVSRALDTEKWVANYFMRMSQSRSPIPISVAKLKDVRDNNFVLRDLIAQYAYRRDLFDYRLPIDSDTYFFGRENIVSQLHDQIRKAQNTGIFGLRKTGKTSLLYQVCRDAERNGYASVLYLDCKSPTIRKKSAVDLIAYITREIAREKASPPLATRGWTCSRDLSV